MSSPSKMDPGRPRCNVHRDPFGTGLIGQFIERNTPHVFAPGAIQRLAEEMTDDLTADQNRLVAEACNAGGATRSVTLEAKGINYGTLAGRRTSGSSRNCTVANITFDTSRVQGIDNTPSADNPDGRHTADRQAVPVERQPGVHPRFQPGRLPQRARHAGGRGRRLQQGRRPRRRRERDDDRRPDSAGHLPGCPTPADLAARAEFSGTPGAGADRRANHQDQRGPPGLSVDGLCDVPRAEPDDRQSDLQRAEPEPVLPGRCRRSRPARAPSQRG